MRKGISLVALIITIIVLIVLTAAVILTGVNVPKNANLAVFLNNLSAVQEAVNLKMLNNMAKYATEEGDLTKYKWVGVIEDYTEQKARDNVGLPKSVLQIAGKDVLPIDSNIKDNLSINETEIEKYYVTLNGKVYYQGFEYEGNIYYDKDTIGLGTPGGSTPAGGEGTVALGNLVPVIDVLSTKVNISVNTIRYYYSSDGGATWLPEGGTTSPNFTIDNLQSLEKYTIKVKAVDSLGAETISGEYAITTLGQPTDGSYCKEKGVNSPKLDDGMTAVYWDGSGNEVLGTSPNFEYNEWYDYTGSTKTFGTDNTSSKWANAKTEDGSYWVWIPRYAYSIGEGYNTSTSSPIEIEFLQNTSSTSSVTGRNFVTTSGKNNWNIHPAFRYNDEEERKLAGIWVAKYEMSNNGSNIPQSKPGKDSRRSISIQDCFNNSKNMYSQYNSHLMRNSEWGAVAYLAQSKYGRNGVEVGMNSNGYYTGGASGATAHTNVGQSTTGNCYGVFDMNGGAWEYVAAGLSANVSSTFKTENAKYYEGYEGYELNEDRYGDAVYETSSGTTGTTSWHGDYSIFVASYGPFFLRGGYYYSGSDAGLFNFDYHAGGALENVSFRSVLWGAL